MSSRRVVVTGIGLVTPFGVGSPHNWKRIMDGISSVKRLPDSQYKKFPCRIAATVPLGKEKNALDIEAHFTPSELRKMSTSTVYAIVAAKEAINESNLLGHPLSETEKERIGVIVGVGMSDIEDVYNTGRLLEESYSKVSPYFIPKMLINMASGQISMTYGFTGPNSCVSTACATGCHAIGDSFRHIKYGDADVMICGGTEAAISPMGIAGFCRLRALSTKYNDTPEEASRPFDSQRDGFVMGEGAGIVVLEEFEHAVNREASILAEVLGYGMSGDAFHITSPRKDGQGAERAMKNALNEAKITPDNVGYINAHATSTPIGDDIELKAIERLFEKSEYLAITSSKGAIGHLLGAAGAVEGIFTVLACHTGFIPPNVNLYDIPSTKEKYDLVPRVGKVWMQNDVRRIALCNSFGFGGTNASLCISSCDFY